MMTTFNPIDPNNFLDITKATAQEVLSFAEEHLMKQGCRSLNSDGDTCAYKGENGLMCAAAPFIPNYVDEMDDGHGWFNLVWDEDFDVPSDHEGLISTLQKFHDDVLGRELSLVRERMVRIEDFHKVKFKYTAEQFVERFHKGNNNG